MLSSRRPIDFVWIALAIAGLLVLLPLQGVRDIDATGAIYALGAGACWAFYIFFGQKAGAGRGPEVVAAALAIAAILVVPIGVAEAGRSLFQPSLIVPGLAIAILSSALPYSLEMAAMTRLPAKTFGTLMSLEPVFGALSGLVFLGEYLSFRQWLAIGAIIVASIGATMTIRPKAAVPAPT
jgi:inner membrane transporter RhtA